MLGVLMSDLSDDGPGLYAIEINPSGIAVEFFVYVRDLTGENIGAATFSNFAIFGYSVSESDYVFKVQKSGGGRETLTAIYKV